MDAIILDLGTYPKVGITPADVDKVADLLRRYTEQPGQPEPQPVTAEPVGVVPSDMEPLVPLANEKVDEST